MVPFGGLLLLILLLSAYLAPAGADDFAVLQEIKAAFPDLSSSAPRAVATRLSVALTERA